MDFVRDILGKISAAADKPDQGILVEGKSEEDAEIIYYHVELLAQANLLTGRRSSTIGPQRNKWTKLDLTWEGHDFLDSVRDPDVWQKTKARVAATTGVAFSVIVEIAKGELKKKNWVCHESASARPCSYSESTRPSAAAKPSTGSEPRLTTW
jgi:hypothetical protein